MKRDPKQFQTKEYDLIIIGGGIYGATICWEAASRGLKVALFEKSDFGSATSANSLKIIHGGFRYLQNFDLNRVRQSIREQKALMYIAPHLVHPLPVLVPTYGHGLKGKEAFSSGLRIFNYLRSAEEQLRDPDKHIPPSRLISRDECVELMPSINRDRLNGAAIFFDAQVYNSERLIISFLYSASEEGAHVANYTEVIDFAKSGNKVKGVKVRDNLTGEVFQARAQIIIIACGPWNAKLLKMLEPVKSNYPTHYAKAINLVTHKLVDKYAVGVLGVNQHRDGNRLPRTKRSYLFVAPWRQNSIIGTGYSLTGKSPDEIAVSEEEIAFLLDEFNRVYPKASLSRKDVLFAHAGLLPVSQKSGNDRNVNLANKFEIVDFSEYGYDGIVSVEGVKYTTARDVAEKTIDYLYPKLGYEFVPSISARIRLYGGEIPGFNTFLSEAETLNGVGLTGAQVRSLAYNFGSKFGEVLNYFDNRAQKDNEISMDIALLEAQIRYSIEREMAQKLGDVVFRRTELGSAGHPGEVRLEYCAKAMGRELGWNQSKVDEELEEVRREFSLFHFDKNEQHRERVGNPAIQ